MGDEPRTPGSTTRRSRGFRRVGFSVLYGALTAFWAAGAVIPGSIIQRVGCGVAAVAFGYSTWNAAVHGEDVDEVGGYD